MSISIKALKKKIAREDKILKANQKTINKNNKEIQLIIANANIDLFPHEIKPIIKWLEQMIEWEQDSMRIRTINAYAQFHSGRISGLNVAIDLLNTIIKNKNI